MDTLFFGRAYIFLIRINILLKSIALSGGNKTCTIKMKVDVIKWGTKDVTMALNLDNILNFS